MQIKCLTKKESFKNLTVNNDYEATEDGEVFIVKNDAGLNSRYAKKYFRVIPATHVTRNLLDLLRVELNENNNHTALTIDITLNRTSRRVDLSLNGSYVSCGIREITNISSLKAIINEIYAHKAADIVGTKTEMFSTIMNLILVWLRTNRTAMCYLFSDQIRETDVELDAVLTSLCTVTDSDERTMVEGHNPNSNNEIRLWVIK